MLSFCLNYINSSTSFCLELFSEMIQEDRSSKSTCGVFLHLRLHLRRQHSSVRELQVLTPAPGFRSSAALLSRKSSSDARLSKQTHFLCRNVWESRGTTKLFKEVKLLFQL